MAGIYVNFDTNAVAMDTHTGAWTTILEVEAEADHRALIRKWHAGLVASAGGPLYIRLVRVSGTFTPSAGGGTVGTVSGSTKSKLDPSASETIQTSAKMGGTIGANSVEPTVDEVLDSATVTQTSGGWTNSGGGIPIPGGGRVALQVQNPDSAVQCKASMQIEE